jgi:putative hydrolase of HD superfamily
MAETRGVRDIFNGIPGLEELVDLWSEFETRSSPEARLVRALDKIELFFQGYLYESFGRGSLDRIFDASENSRDMDVHPFVEELRNTILSLRKKGGDESAGRAVDSAL